MVYNIAYRHRLALRFMEANNTNSQPEYSYNAAKFSHNHRRRHGHRSKSLFQHALQRRYLNEWVESPPALYLADNPDHWFPSFRHELEIWRDTMHPPEIRKKLLLPNTVIAIRPNRTSFETSRLVASVGLGRAWGFGYEERAREQTVRVDVPRVLLTAAVRWLLAAGYEDVGGVWFPTPAAQMRSGNSKNK